jgi:hypothetical protein
MRRSPPRSRVPAVSPELQARAVAPPGRGAVPTSRPAIGRKPQALSAASGAQSPRSIIAAVKARGAAPCRSRDSARGRADTTSVSAPPTAGRALGHILRRGADHERHQREWPESSVCRNGSSTPARAPARAERGRDHTGQIGGERRQRAARSTGTRGRAASRKASAVGPAIPRSATT